MTLDNDKDFTALFSMMVSNDLHLTHGIYDTNWLLLIRRINDTIILNSRKDSQCTLALIICKQHNNDIAKEVIGA